MAKGLKINLGSINSVSNSCKEDGRISDLAGQSQKNINEIQRKMLLMDGKTYKDFLNLIDDLERELRGMKNNIESVSKDLNRYLNKMDEATPINYDSDIFIASNFSDIKKYEKRVSQNCINYLGSITNARLFASKPKLTVNDIELGSENNDFYRKQEVYNVFCEGLDRLRSNFLCDDYLLTVKEQTRAICDFYDRDYDMSDHVKKVGVYAAEFVAIAVVTTVVTTAVVASTPLATGTIILTLVVDAGISFVYNLVTTSYHEFKSGESLGELLGSGLKSGVINATSSIVFAGPMHYISFKPMSNVSVKNFIDDLTGKSQYKISSINLGLDDMSFSDRILDDINAENVIKNIIAENQHSYMSDLIYEHNRTATTKVDSDIAPTYGPQKPVSELDIHDYLNEMNAQDSSEIPEDFDISDYFNSDEINLEDTCTASEGGEITIESFRQYIKSVS